jgi:RNA polymerase subunit RPABC4/transcription elongation factor Spt4
MNALAYCSVNAIESETSAIARGLRQRDPDLTGPSHRAISASASSLWARAVLGGLAGIGGGCLLLLIGYINRDAKRRGMSPTLWTIVAVIIPNALGMILYFILRQPRSSVCPQCGAAVQTGFNFCPRCSYKLSPSCPQCQRVVGVNDVYCPYCGTSLRNQAVSDSGSQQGFPANE